MLDERTILVMMAVMQLLLALLAAAVRRGHAEFAAGMGSWALGVTLMSCGALATVLGDGSQASWRLAISNGFYVPGMSLLGFGMLRFAGQSPRAARWVAATLLVYLVGVALSRQAEQAPFRIAFFMLQQMTVGALSLHALLRCDAPRTSIGWVVTVLAMALLTAAGGVRAAMALTGWMQFRLLAGSPLIWLVMSVLGLVQLLGTVGLILLAGERTRRRLEQLASHDGLTGLLTRGGFAELAGHVLAASRRQTRAVGFLIVDIDHFKAINDGHGHQTGDAVLAEVARRLREGAREIDLVSRFGGEEFALLLPQADLEQARQAGERLRQRVTAAPVRYGEKALPVTISIGVSSGDAAGIDIDRLYREADAALYRAKAGGRNRVEVADGNAVAATMPA